LIDESRRNISKFDIRLIYLMEKNYFYPSKLRGNLCEEFLR
jgi:hypothetical protein